MPRRTHPKSDQDSTKSARGVAARPASGSPYAGGSSPPGSGHVRRTASSDPAPLDGLGATRMLAIVLIGLGLLCAAIAGALIFVVAGGASQQDCNWGASSIVIVNGKVVAGPDVTGCAP
jgi:hypothetical protein